MKELESISHAIQVRSPGPCRYYGSAIDARKQAAVDSTLVLHAKGACTIRSSMLEFLHLYIFCALSFTVLPAAHRQQLLAERAASCTTILRQDRSCAAPGCVAERLSI